MAKIIHFQVGKNGVTDGVIASLRLAFNKNKMVKVQFLKSSGLKHEGVEEAGKKIAKSLGPNFFSKRVGLTLTIRRFSKPVK